MVRLANEEQIFLILNLCSLSNLVILKWKTNGVNKNRLPMWLNRGKNLQGDLLDFDLSLNPVGEDAIVLHHYY